MCMGNSPTHTLEGATLPPRVRDLPEPPARLYLHGILPRGPCVGIVGTRHPTAEALEYAEQFSSWLARKGVAIVSGGAKGIDAAAHQGALAASGVTLVVAPSGFDRPYPAEHGDLFREIVARGGGHVSSFIGSVEPRRHQFFARNALLAALCHALVVVEAPLRSGARNTAHWARRLARACFVVPSTPWNERGLGCIAELQRGARLLAAPQEVLDCLRQQGLYAVSGGLTPDARGPGSSERGLAGGSLAGPSSMGRPQPGAAELAGSAKKKKAKGRRSRGSPTADGGGRSAPRGSRPIADEDAGLASAILTAIDAGAAYVEQIAEQIGVDPLHVNHALLRLTLCGEIDQGPCGQVTRGRR
jgi:DNA processing protein